jgi:hypothetical protein
MAQSRGFSERPVIPDFQPIQGFPDGEPVIWSHAVEALL